jgi:hypothetical protein
MNICLFPLQKIKSGKGKSKSMKALFILIVSLSFSLIAFGQQKLPSSNFTGILKDTNKNGKLLSETPYDNGKINGIKKIYYENGDVEWEVPYRNDTINGIAKEYYYGKRLWHEVFCTNGKKMEL